MRDWTKLEPLPGRNNPCGCCPPIYPALSMHDRIAVGFGFAGVSRDGEMVWVEPFNSEEWDDMPTLMTFENMARKDPNHDWRAVMNGPLHGETYQRQGRNEWVLIKKTDGFA